jgi:protein involved in polysaccharide export with SLBB domain
MQRHSTPFRRALALFLCCQPALWMSNVALAQSIEQAAQGDPRLMQGQQMPAEAQRFFQQQGGSVQGQQGGSMPFQFPPANVPGDPDGMRPEKSAQQFAPLPLPPLDEPIDPARYVLGPGDVLELHFWGVENFKMRVVVDLEGRAFLPRVGYLALQGRTLAEGQGMLRDSATRMFPKLSFGATLIEPRTFLVQVVDDVARPGSYSAKAIDRVATLINRAGGFGPNASRRRIEVKRRDGTVVTADLLLYSITGDVKHNPYVLDGDAIRVPFQSLVASIYGAVNRPGRYELVGASDLDELVELAGGLTPGATTRLPVQVVRRADEEKLARLSFDFAPEGKLPTVAMSREDVVWIPAFVELQQSVTITGALAGVAATAGTAGTTGAINLAGSASGAAGGKEDTSATRRLPFAKGDTVSALLEGGPARGSEGLLHPPGQPGDPGGPLRAHHAARPEGRPGRGAGRHHRHPVHSPQRPRRGRGLQAGPVPVQPQLRRRAVPGPCRWHEPLRPEHRQRLPRHPERGDEGVRPGPQGGTRGVARGPGTELLEE